MSGFIAGISHNHIAAAGRLLGMLVYILDRRHRRIVRRNLKFIYPEWSISQIRTFSRLIFQNMGITVLEFCQIISFSRSDILSRVRIKGKKNLLKAIESNKGVIFISAHLGNWEMSPLAVSIYLEKPILLIARKIRSKALEWWIYKIRSRFGNIVVDKKGALPKMVRTLSKGEMLGLLIDQETTHSEGIKVTFFGRTVTATPAAAILARRLGSMVLPGFCVRKPGGGLLLIIEPPVTLIKTDDVRTDLQTNTQIMTDVIEKTVRQYFEQWFWLHKRWKRHYPYLYHEDIARRQRRREKRKRLSA